MKEHITRDFGTQDKATARIHELEDRLGLPHSVVAESITDAWDRLSILEELAAAKGVNATSTGTAAKSPATRHVTSTSTGTASDKPLHGVDRIARAFASTQSK